jgi:hypothetical protein
MTSVMLLLMSWLNLLVVVRLLEVWMVKCLLTVFTGFLLALVQIGLTVVLVVVVVGLFPTFHVNLGVGFKLCSVVSLVLGSSRRICSL